MSGVGQHPTIECIEDTQYEGLCRWGHALYRQWITACHARFFLKRYAIDSSAALLQAA